MSKYVLIVIPWCESSVHPFGAAVHSQNYIKYRMKYLFSVISTKKKHVKVYVVLPSPFSSWYADPSTWSFHAFSQMKDAGAE